ncbi:MAG: molybdate ABC transporter permease subunit, partial [Actinomycetota bacterium]|nr:molybdate ABC transporter permease subunit [Actinomycetota bacterium]
MKKAAVPLVAAAAMALMVLPLAGLLARAPWSTLGTELATREAREALRLSLVCSLGALAVAVV